MHDAATRALMRHETKWARDAPTSGPAGEPSEKGSPMKKISKRRHTHHRKPPSGADNHFQRMEHDAEEGHPIDLVVEKRVQHRAARKRLIDLQNKILERLGDNKKPFFALEELRMHVRASLPGHPGEPRRAAQLQRGPRPGDRRRGGRGRAGAIPARANAPRGTATDTPCDVPGAAREGDARTLRSRAFVRAEENTCVGFA